MPGRRTPVLARIRATALQPVLTQVARRNARARELAATMQLPCTACRAALAAHIGPRNNWIGCRKAGR